MQPSTSAMSLALPRPRRAAAVARRVAPGGALDPGARGFVLTDLPTSVMGITVDGADVTPDADGFVPVLTSGHAVPVEVTTPGTVSRFYGRLLGGPPRVVSFDDMPLYRTDGELLRSAPARLELLGLPEDARVQVSANAIPGTPVEQTLRIASPAAGSGAFGEWNGARSVFTLLLPDPPGIPRTVVVSLPDASVPGGWRSVYRGEFTMEGGEIRDVPLAYLRLATRTPPSSPGGTPTPTASGRPGGTPTPTASGQPGVTAAPGRSTLVFDVTPKTAVVLFNDTALRDPSAPLSVPPGVYRVDASADGYEKLHQQVIARPNETLRVSVALKPVARKEGWSAGRIALVSGIALGAVGLVVGGAVYFSRRGDAQPQGAPALPERSNPRRPADRDGFIAVRKPTKAQLKDRDSLEKLVREFVLANGGRETAAGLAKMTDDTGTRPWYELPTRLGPLRVHVVGDWVSGSFDDVERAVAHFGRNGDLNPNSGKWNWGTGMGAPSEYLFRIWQGEVSKILPQG